MDVAHKAVIIIGTHASLSLSHTHTSTQSYENPISLCVLNPSHNFPSGHKYPGQFTETC